MPFGSRRGTESKRALDSVINQLDATALMAVFRGARYPAKPIPSFPKHAQGLESGQEKIAAAAHRHVLLKIVDAPP